MKLYLALFSCEKYKKMQAQRITCTVLNLHTCREKERTQHFFFPTSEKNPEQQNRIRNVSLHTGHCRCYGFVQLF